MYGAMSEFEIIKLLTKRAQPAQGGVLVGPGDDCAVLSMNDEYDLVVSTDMLIEDQHFCRSFSSWEERAEKALMSSASDIAAMGAKAECYTFSLALPGQDSQKIASELSKGFRLAEQRTALQLIGGDTCKSDKVTFSITVFGKVAKGKALLRSGAKAGDDIYVTGSLGAAALGLCCLQRKVKDEMTTAFVQRFNLPQARLKEARVLQNANCISSMIDLSDGLFKDMSHIADASGVGFLLELEKLPKLANMDMLCKQLNLNATELLLAGGEDYELLFTVPRSGAKALQSACQAKENQPLASVACIGTIVEDSSERAVLGADGSRLVPQRHGFDHFNE